MVSLIADPILTSQLCLILQWTKEDGHRTSTSAVPNLFVPLNTNPKEVQEMRNKVRALAREGGGCRGGRDTCAVGQSTLAVVQGFCCQRDAAEATSALLLLLC